MDASEIFPGKINFRVAGRIIAPTHTKVPVSSFFCPTPHVTLTRQKGFCRYDHVKDLKIGRLLWIT